MNKILQNNNGIRKNLIKQISEALDTVLETGFGRIEIVIDEDKGIYDVIPSPRIRVKS